MAQQYSELYTDLCKTEEVPHCICPLGGLKGGTKEEKHHCTLKVTDLCEVEEEGELPLSLGWEEGGMKEGKNHCSLKDTDLCK